MTKKVKVQFLGNSADDVTQSCYQISDGEHVILLDYGLYQDQNPVENYKGNHRRVKEIKPRAIDAICVSHANIDHCGALPALYRHGCDALIYVPEGNRELIRLMLQDSAKIMESDAIVLRKYHGIKAVPLYDADDIEICMEHMIELPMGDRCEIVGGVVLQFYAANHIVSAGQIRLDFKDFGKRILYTGDIGGIHQEKDYAEPFAYPEEYMDLVIGESTYAGDRRKQSEKDRGKDLEKIRHIVNETCFECGGKVLFPVFSMDRLQNIMTALWDIYHDDPEFDLPIVIDTPLGIKVTRLYESILARGLDKWERVVSWDKFQFSEDFESSMMWQDDNRPMIVLASSGMCTNGRSVAWLKKLLPSAKNHICFCGYAAVGSLGYKIKEGKDPVIQIEGKKVKNRAAITSLFSFSSHACRDDLMEYYTTLRYGKLCLVHGDKNAKREFSEDLKEKLAAELNTADVVCAFSGYVAMV